MSSTIVEGFDEIYADLDDMNISDFKKRRVLNDVADDAVKVASQASYKRTGRLSKSWKKRPKRVDGNIGVQVYSKSYHDIYNELGSSKNKKHVGFFSRAINENTDKFFKKIEKGVLNGK
ncbi:HK97 gp10 family phage protein [Tissierella creatinophila]|uniref:Phage protein, HK97 gp10 family n=1 Tax=Tissierella creatinophila DSM 6911 TaxID=1123403 RepID=A0A1U7M6D1_TISCR|nr:HK97 gp10 family phage protein [Tissierella creatinophila]OLS02884.1 hypothetical protein TICRE_11570 [Tissierella creatinophila DSM 6911]